MLGLHLYRYLSVNSPELIFGLGLGLAMLLVVCVEVGNNSGALTDKYPTLYNIGQPITPQLRV